jgi:hypothetical protein
MDSDSSSSSEQLGGGAINEKQRTFQQHKNNLVSGTSNNNGKIDAWDPSDNLSHMLHALVGLDRYPNYLSRLNNDDVISIERALEETLIKVRQQKTQITQRRDGLRELVKKYNNQLTDSSTISDDDSTLHVSSLPPPQTWSELKNVLCEEAFEVVYRSIISSSKSGRQIPTLQDVMSGKVEVHLDPALLENWMSQECFDVYSFQLLRKDFCCLIRKTITDLSKLGESNEFNSLLLGRRPIDFDAVGMGWITDMLLHIFIIPMSKLLFANTEKLLSDEDASSNNMNGKILNWRQGYVAGYSANPKGEKAATRHRLVPHSDDSEVTLNCCLGEEDFKGGAVEFYGLRGTPDEGELLGQVDRPDIGKACIHAGRHLVSFSSYC